MPRKITLCVVGCGSVAEEHIRAFRAIRSARIAAVVSRNEERAERARRLASAEARFASLGDALAWDGFEVCVLCTPNHTHYEMSKAILRSGRHLLLEKPMALALRQSRHLVRLAVERDLALMVAQTMRFQPAFLKARQAIRQGRVGRVLLVSGRWMEDRRIARNWRGKPIDMSRANRESLIFHHGCHTVDIVRWLLDADVTSVSAASSTAKNGIVFDSDLAILMKMADGVAVSLVHSFSAGIADRSMVITGEKETLRIDGGCRVRLGDELLLDHDFDREFARGVLNQDRAFVRALQTGEAPPASGADVCETMAVLEKIRRQTGAAAH